MDELVQAVAAKVGISEEQARGAVETVVEHIKARLPDFAAAHVDSALGLVGGSVGGLDISSVTGALGGLFGKKE